MRKDIDKPTRIDGTRIANRHTRTVYRGWDRVELFDRDDDPGELRNSFADPGYAKARAQWMERFVQADLQREPAPQQRISGASGLR